ncbi:hypothetical protein M0813_11520 [Anaeramoeba flamelloides]|uniref:Uncharacterized protein n=1 Tax=Anaeramoeba flamelloides TaxID=1746091 RepID=A0ABQ8ZEG7_9EUKA|nr:hypothetical protein M0813_11520 [Anaeramoeba flamelloides]
MKNNYKYKLFPFQSTPLRELVQIEDSKIHNVTFLENPKIKRIDFDINKRREAKANRFLKLFKQSNNQLSLSTTNKYPNLESLIKINEKTFNNLETKHHNIKKEKQTKLEVLKLYQLKKIEKPILKNFSKQSKIKLQFSKIEFDLKIKNQKNGLFEEIRYIEQQNRNEKIDKNIKLIKDIKTNQMKMEKIFYLKTFIVEVKSNLYIDTIKQLFKYQQINYSKEDLFLRNKKFLPKDILSTLKKNNKKKKKKKYLKKLTIKKKIQKQEDLQIKKFELPSLPSLLNDPNNQLTLQKINDSERKRSFNLSSTNLEGNTPNPNNNSKLTDIHQILKSPHGYKKFEDQIIFEESNLKINNQIKLLPKIVIPDNSFFSKANQIYKEHDFIFPQKGIEMLEIKLGINFDKFYFFKKYKNFQILKKPQFKKLRNSNTKQYLIDFQLLKDKKKEKIYKIPDYIESISKSGNSINQNIVENKKKIQVVGSEKKENIERFFCKENVNEDGMIIDKPKRKKKKKRKKSKLFNYQNLIPFPFKKSLKAFIFLNGSKLKKSMNQELAFDNGKNKNLNEKNNTKKTESLKKKNNKRGFDNNHFKREENKDKTCLFKKNQIFTNTSFKVIINEPFLKDINLIKILQTRYNFQFLERRLSTKITMIIDEETCLILKYITQIDSIISIISSIQVRLTYVKIWVLLRCKKKNSQYLMDFNKKKKQSVNLKELIDLNIIDFNSYSSLNLLMHKSIQFGIDLKILYCWSDQSCCKLINWICIETSKTNQNFSNNFWKRNWLLEKESYHERFLSSFPSISPFVAQFMLTLLSCNQIINMKDIEDAYTIFKFLPKKSIQSFYFLLHYKMKIKSEDEHLIKYKKKINWWKNKMQIL